MIGTLQCVVLDCPDPLALARFYRELFGGEVNRPDPRWLLDDDWATLHIGDGAAGGSRTVLAFQRAGEDYRPPSWPDPARPQQFHLDVAVTDMDGAEARVLALGASRLTPGADGGGEPQEWRVFADPAGHPFCLCPAGEAG